MKKEDVIKIVEEIYNIPSDSENDILKIQEKLVDMQLLVQNGKLESLLQFTLLNLFIEELK